MPWSVDDKASSFETPRSKCDTLRGAAPCYPGRACGGGLHICKAICNVSMSGTVLRTWSNIVCMMGRGRRQGGDQQLPKRTP